MQGVVRCWSALVQRRCAAAAAPHASWRCHMLSLPAVLMPPGPPGPWPPALQLPGRCTSVFTSIFFNNLLPGGGMEPNKQPDGTYSLFLPVGDAKVGLWPCTRVRCSRARCAPFWLPAWRRCPLHAYVLAMHELAAPRGPAWRCWRVSNPPPPSLPSPQHLLPSIHSCPGATPKTLAVWRRP